MLRLAKVAKASLPPGLGPGIDRFPGAYAGGRLRLVRLPRRTAPLPVGLSFRCWSCAAAAGASRRSFALRRCVPATAVAVVIQASPSVRTLEFG